MFPREASQPAGRQEAHVLPRLRLTAPPRSLPILVAAAAVSGLLLWLALPPADLGPLGMVALVPILAAVRGARARRGAVAGFVFGVAFYGLLLSWLVPVTALGWAVLVLSLGAWYAGAFAYVAAVWRDGRPFRSALAVAAGWAAIEWLRSQWPFGGWNWVGLGDTAHDNPLLLPLASVIGTLGLSFVIAAVSALVVAALARLPRWGSGARLLAPAVALAVLPVAIPLPAAHGEPVSVAVVQGNVPEEVGTASRILVDRFVAENHARAHVGLAGERPDLVVWPENALDQDPTRDPALQALVTSAVRTVRAPTLVGAITTGAEGRLFNENLLYGADGRIVGRYAKNHLLPFGEYVPFRRFLGWVPDIERVRADLTPGTRPGTFAIPAGWFAAIICFENAFPGEVRRVVGADESFLVVSTNNSTFGRSAAPAQHLVLSEMRAVENGRWVVHAALSGISGLISPAGEVVASTPLFEPAVLRGAVREASGRTPFNRIGGWLPPLYLAGAALALLTPRRARRRTAEPLPANPRAAVVLPTYNERDTIEQVVDRLLSAADVDVKVVDDSSPDGTGDIVRKLAEREPRVTLIDRPEKGGLASAYLDGFVRAIAEGYDLVVEMDADLSHSPEELPRLLEAARDHHLVVGSRYVPGGAVRNWSLFRRVLSRGGNLYVRVLLGLPVADSTSGFRAYRRDAIRELITHQVRSEGYAFQIELAYRAWRRGLSVGEVPITFAERRHGHSKLSRGIVLEALWHVFLWALRDRLLRRPLERPAEA
ncbi:MAG TPA: apolipoprotein N-acyltransferase [Actinomycetota bacterium]|nr:apolipoprotein N-acyltransferase [Actinomycetota bacterium]